MAKQANETPMIERVRGLVYQTANDDDPLDFYRAALTLGCTEAEAEDFDVTLTLRVMTARGAI